MTRFRRSIIKNVPAQVLVLTTFGLIAPSLFAASDSKTVDATSVADAGLVRIVMATRQGPITIDLDTKRAPVSANNFLRYVDSGSLDGGTFYRSVRLDNQRPSEVPIQVIQGGIGALEPSDKPRENFPAIEHESTATTGLTHGPGTISMARGKPGTAQSEFFISIGNNPELDAGGKRNPDGLGFAAFGQVVGGMDVVHLIHRASTAASREMDLGVMTGQLLDNQVEICKVFRALPEKTGKPKAALQEAAIACAKK